MPGHNSGVTIAAGFDLGHHSLADLRGFNLPEDLIQRLSPYLGLKGQAARDALAKNSVSINPNEAAQINKVVYPSKLNAAAEAFNKAKGALKSHTKMAGLATNTTGGQGEFAQLPWQAQTVIADLWFNMGDLSSSAPTLWKQVTSGDWEGAYQNLMHFTHVDPVLARRARRNAKLLKDAIDIGTLPSS